MAGRKRKVLRGRSKDAIPARQAARPRYTYLPRVDLISAGVPCQDVSVAGKRVGLKGKRTGLFYDFARILRELRPTWFVFENVPGLLSSNRGRDFAEVLRVLMVECGYGVCWRVLNSQFFRVAQRRRRLFIVGCLGKPCPPEVLFEPEGGEGDITEGRKAGQDVAYALAAGSGGSKFGSGRDSQDTFAVVGSLKGRRYGGFMPNAEEAADGQLIATALSASAGHHGHSSPRGDGSDNLVAALNSGGNSGGFRTEPGEHIIAIAENQRGEIRTSKVAPQLSAGGGKPGSRYSAVAYRLREDPGGIGQGHNTNFVSTAADPNGVRDFARLPKGLDSARYRALGNAVTVSVAQWIAERIKEVSRD